MTFQKEMIDFIYLYNFQCHDYLSEKYASSGDKFKKLFKNKLTRELQEKQVVVSFEEAPVLPLIFSKPFDWI